MSIREVSEWYRLSVRPSLQLEEQKQEGMDGQKAGRREYEGMLRAVVADEVVHPLERLLMDQNAQRLTHGGGLHHVSSENVQM